ncbi:MAG TPA: SDR family oxidoreductase [Puia sp.]|nr:SDR family oxidoreductase [Puia sp.]
MLLKNKNAVIYGAGGSVGTAIARAFAQEGAKVFLTDHTVERIGQTAGEIIRNGGYAEFAQVDALNQPEVERHLESLIEKHHQIDISFNLISLNDVHGIPLSDIPIDQFLTPVTTAMRSHFITANAAAQKMIEQKRGVILMLTANAAKKPYENTGGFGVACASLEALSRQFAVELGKYGIRVVCLRSAGSPDAKGVHEAFTEHARMAKVSEEEFERQFAERTMLKRLPRLKEIADAAVLVASDKASSITSAIINVTCGELAD